MIRTIRGVQSLHYTAPEWGGGQSGGGAQYCARGRPLCLVFETMITAAARGEWSLLLARLSVQVSHVS